MKKAALLLFIIPVFFTSCYMHKNTIMIKGSDARFTTMQAALDSAKEGNTIIVYPGKYESNEELLLRTTNLTIEGKGKAEIVCTNMQANVFWIDGKNITVRNIMARHIKPDFWADCVGNVITVDVAGGVLIEKCNLNGCGRVGVYVQGGVNIVLKNNFIHDNTVCAVDINGQQYFGETTVRSDIKFINNRFSNNGQSHK